MPNSDPRIVAHYRASLAHIQNAQNELGRAAQLLSSINFGGAVDWRRGNREYDRIHKLWYGLEARISKLRRERLDDGHGEHYPCSACKAVEAKRSA